jgi:hypothetical protein
MNRYCIEWIQGWCQENGWTDLFVERHEYWAFPPNAVLPLPIPAQALQTLKAEKGLSPQEKIWYGTASVSALIALVLSYCFRCPMPLVAAFTICTIIFAQD